METQDRQAIDGLFDRLDDVARRNAPRDPEAEALIRERIARSPNAPYLMAQTIVMQDYALSDAQRRIEELEAQASARPAGGGGFLSGLFGGGSQQPSAPAPRGSVPSVPMGAPPRPMGAQGGPQTLPGQQTWPGQQTLPGQQTWPGQQTLSGQQTLPGQQTRGGGFLAGAAQTAMGVAGGVLIGSAIGSIFGGDEAKAAAAPAAEPAQPADTAAAEPTADDSGGGVFDSFFGGDESA